MRCVPVLKRILIFVHTSVHDLLLLASSRADFLHFWLSIDALCHFSHFTNGHVPGVLTLRSGSNGAGPGVEFIWTGATPQSLFLAARVEITARNRYSGLVSILMAVGLRLVLLVGAFCSQRVQGLILLRWLLRRCRAVPWLL